MSVVPGRSAVPELAEPRGAVAGDQRRGGRASRRSARASGASGSRARADERRASARGQRRAALEVRDDRRLLPGDVARRAGRQREARHGAARRPRARGARRPGTGRTRARAPRRGPRGRRRARRRPRRRRAPDAERDVEQDAILGAHRLALGAVDDDDRPRARGDRRELDRGREAGAAPPAQAGALDLADEVRARRRAAARAASRWRADEIVPCARRGPPAVDRSWSFPVVVVCSPPRSELGVPAFAAQPLASGPTAARRRGR